MGNIICLCVNMGYVLYLIEFFGFDWDDKCVCRVGLDYYEFVEVKCYVNFEIYLVEWNFKWVFVCIIKGKVFYFDVQYQVGDVLLFGFEICGLFDDIIELLLLV